MMITYNDDTNDDDWHYGDEASDAGDNKDDGTIMIMKMTLIIDSIIDYVDTMKMIMILIMQIKVVMIKMMMV